MAAVFHFRRFHFDTSNASNVSNTSNHYHHNHHLVVLNDFIFFIDAGQSEDR